PGPSTWELSSFPAGEGELPVGGISWYEAMAYAAFEGRALPTVRHWSRASGTTGTWGARWLVAASNFGGKGPLPVGRPRALGRFGAYAMAGNVREWCFNEEEGSSGHRFLLGGGWNDPPYAFGDLYAQPPLDRSPTNGLRLVTYGNDRTGVEEAQKPIVRAFRDY